MAAAALAPESDEPLAITAFVGKQSRGVPVAVDRSGLGAPFAAHGQTLFTTRMGQLKLSCAQCHDGLAGQHLAGAFIPQGQPNGYPLYRLEWQSPRSPDLTDLEFYLASRADGLPVETPAVRS